MNLFKKIITFLFADDETQENAKVNTDSKLEFEVVDKEKSIKYNFNSEQ